MISNAGLLSWLYGIPGRWNWFENGRQSSRRHRQQFHYALRCSEKQKRNVETSLILALFSPLFVSLSVCVCVCCRCCCCCCCSSLFLFLFFVFFLFLALFFSFLSEVNTLGSPGSMKEECQLGALYWSVAMPISSSASPDMNLNIGFPILMLSLVWFVNLFKESRRISNNPIQSFRRGFLRPINCDASDDVAENPQSIWKAQMAECW